ncbi:hypothetical protein A2U01_0102382, partial [Trifolium medium]|nr:hypothetical protein [Trifolium medium]
SLLMIQWEERQLAQSYRLDEAPSTSQAAPSTSQGAPSTSQAAPSTSHAASPDSEESEYSLQPNFQ